MIDTGGNAIDRTPFASTAVVFGSCTITGLGSVYPVPLSIHMVLMMSRPIQELKETSCWVAFSALLIRSNAQDVPCCFTAHVLTLCEEPTNINVPLRKYFPTNTSAFPIAVKELSSCRARHKREAKALLKYLHQQQIQVLDYHQI